MSIENSLERIATALETLAGKPVASAPETAPPAPKTRAAKQAAAVQTAPPATETDDFLGDDAPAASPPKVYTKDEVRAAVVAYQKRHNKDKAAALVASFGTGTLGSIPAEKYPEVIEAASK